MILICITFVIIFSTDLNSNRLVQCMQGVFNTVLSTVIPNQNVHNDKILMNRERLLALYKKIRKLCRPNNCQKSSTTSNGQHGFFNQISHVVDEFFGENYNKAESVLNEKLKRFLTILEQMLQLNSAYFNSSADLGN